MQALLGLLLLCTVGIAALITHQRSKALAAPLGQTHSAGPLIMKMPIGWTVIDIRHLGWLETIAREPPRNGQERIITVMQRRGVNLDTRQYLAGFIGGPMRAVEELNFLGETGYLVTVGGRVRVGTGQEIPPVLLAGAVLKNDLALIVKLEGEGVEGPSSRRLMRQFIASLQRATPPRRQ